jgi:xylan 1,4-beta-xylosidase
MFWLVTTNIDDIRRGHLIVTASSPEGPWSDPVYTVGAIGIDPDLAWDEAGVCYLTWSDVIQHGISQVRINPLTGELLGQPRIIWRGSGLSNPEGPHLIHRDGWWYLVVAEGGTHTGHGVSVARSRSISGPFDAHPNNPVFSHRSTPHEVQAVGHADLVELANGEWVAYHLGIRQRGSFPRFHTNGRETFAIRVVWEEDWPVFVEDSLEVPAADNSFEDHFLENRLNQRWICPGTNPATFAHPGISGLQLSEGRSADEGSQHRILATRVTDDEWHATVTATSGDLALIVRIDDEHWMAVERIGSYLRVRNRIGSTLVTSAEYTVQDIGQYQLSIKAEQSPKRQFRSGPDIIRLSFWEKQTFHELAALDGRYLSTEVAGGFTGRVVGFEALEGQAQVTHFSYKAL